jgi:hypothetical protein
MKELKLGQAITLHSNSADKLTGIISDIKDNIITLISCKGSKIKFRNEIPMSKISLGFLHVLYCPQCPNCGRYMVELFLSGDLDNMPSGYTCRCGEFVSSSYHYFYK